MGPACLLAVQRDLAAIRHVPVLHVLVVAVGAMAPVGSPGQVGEFLLKVQGQGPESGLAGPVS